MTGTALKKRIAGGFGAQAYSQAIQLIIRLSEIPLFLSIWGTTEYGQWLLISAIPAYLAFADGGFATTSAREMTMLCSRGDESGALKVFQSTLSLILIISLLLSLIIGLTIFFTGVIEYLVHDTSSAADIKISLFILIVYVLSGFQSGLYYGVFCAQRRYALGARLTATFSLVGMLFSVLGAALFDSLTGAALGLLAGRFVHLVIYWSTLRRVAPWCRLGFRHASRDVLKGLLLPSLGSMTIPIGIGGNISAMRILVGTMLGPEILTLFTAMRTLARAAQTPTLVIIRIAEPEMAIAFGDAALGTVRKLFLYSSKLAIWSGLISGLAIYLSGDFIFRFWLHGEFQVDWLTFAALLAASLIYGLWYTGLQVAYATNRVHKIAIPFALIYGFGALGMAWVGMKLLGLPGAAIALVLVEVLMCFIAIPQALSLSGESFRAFACAVITPPLKEIRKLLRR